MFGKYIQSKIYSVTVPLDELEKHIHVDSISSVQVNADFLNGGISFFTVQFSEV